MVFTFLGYFVGVYPAVKWVVSSPVYVTQWISSIPTFGPFQGLYNVNIISVVKSDAKLDNYSPCRVPLRINFFYWVSGGEMIYFGSNSRHSFYCFWILKLLKHRNEIFYVLSTSGQCVKLKNHGISRLYFLPCSRMSKMH